MVCGRPSDGAEGLLPGACGAVLSGGCCVDSCMAMFGRVGGGLPGSDSFGLLPPGTGCLGPTVRGGGDDSPAEPGFGCPA